MRSFPAGALSKTIDVFLQNSSSTTGAGLTGLAYNSSGLKCYYRKGQTGSATQLTLASQTVGGAYTSGGFVEIDATNMPGKYRLDIANGMIDTLGEVQVFISGATNLAPYDETLTVVRLGVPKGIAFSGFEFLMVDSSDHVSGKTGLTVTSQRSIDGGSFSNCSNSASEVANGVYKINLSASDLAGDYITLKFTATGADARFIPLVTTG